MLSQDQRNAIYTNIETAYTIDSHNYTAIKTYPAHWSGIIDTPVILLNYITDGTLKQDSVGKRAEYDTALLSVDVMAHTDNTNGVHGIKMAREIARTLILWFKQTFDTALKDDGVQAMQTLPVKDLSFLEEKIFRMQFEVKILYKLI